MKPLLQSLSKLLAVMVTMLAAHTGLALTYVWNVASPAANNWNVSGNWNISGNPGVADTALFGDLGTGSDSLTVNNVVSVNATIAALSYTNSLAGTWHVTEIPASVTLTVSGNVVVGGGTINNLNTSAAMVGGGTFFASGNSFTVGNGGSANPLTPGTLDLANLSNFVYNAASGTLGIAASGSRAMGTLTLAAASNRITAATININGASGTGSSPLMNLGSGTNILNVNTFNVGGGRSTTTVQFPGADGGLRLRGAGGTDSDRTTMTVGNRNTGGTSTLTTTGNVLLNGHPVDLKFNTLTLGLMSRNGTEANFNGVGNFQFDQGTVDATTVTMAVSSGNSPTSRATGTLTVGGGGTLLAGSVSLANISSGVAGQSASGTLNVSGGTATVTGNITKTTSTGSTGTVDVASSGTLVVQGRIGSVANPIDNLNLTDANLTVAASATVTNIAVINLTTGGSTNIINISSVPAITGYPAQFPVISYVSAIGGVGFDNNIGLGTLPAASPAYVGFLSNNTTTLTIDLVITAGPAPAQPVTWSGAESGAWDTTALNWLVGVLPTNYNNAGDFVTFGDTALTSTVHLVTATLTPGSITVNNSLLNYTFTGSGKLSGSTGLTKQGSGTLILENSGVNDFSGNISIAGTLQVGTGGTAGNLPTTGSITDYGSLVFNRSDNFTQPNVISGTGTVTKNGANTLTLNGANNFSGGLTANSGTVRLTTVNSGGSGTVTVNSGGTVVFGAQQTNSGIVMAGGTFGVSVSLNPLVDDLTAQASTTSTVYMADPQNLAPTDGNELAFTGTWHGSGNITVLTVTNDTSADSGNGFRLRSPAASDFSGTLTLGNMVKGELQTTVAGPFSPAGTGKIVLT